ncbi:MAG: ABC transporter ATP-binding protein [Cloacibacterium sp.]|nr:ABC transporter ATP-binding protein [Cloacibacterium sp.]
MLLDIKNLHFSYHPEKPLFRNFNLRVERGKIIALVGESGCGKSTLLNLIYGLLSWQQGEIIFDGKKLLGPKGNIIPGEKEIKLVAQHYNLMPNHTVYENVGKYISNIRQDKKKQIVHQLLEIVGLEDFAHTLPKKLSGGQQQRVAIAKALSTEPKLLLLDEPFSNLDFSRKIELRERLFNYVKENELSLIISTHEILEIMPWADQLIVLNEGRLIQNDSPEITYKEPYNEYVARLFGEVNVFSEEEKKQFKLSKNYYYPHEVIIGDEGEEVPVLESRFAGNHYWNKLFWNNRNLIVYSPNWLFGRVKIKLSQNLT